MPTNAADPAAVDPALAGGSTTGGQPGSTLDLNKPLEEQVAEWQKRFGGLQGRFQQEQTKVLNAQAKLMDTEALLTAAVGDKEALALEKTKLEKDLADLAAKQAESAAATARLQLIALEFPALLSFEKDGLLPAGSGDELKAKLTTFTTRIGTQAAAAATAAALPVGATTALPAAVNPTQSTLMSQLVAARKAGNDAEYEKARAELIKLQPMDPTLATQTPAPAAA